jgi:hypothetical protein
MPGMSSMPTMSGMPGMPGMPSMQEPSMPTMTAMSGMPSMPTMPTMSGMPGMSGMQSSDLKNQLLQSQIEKTRLETELNKYKIADMEKQLSQTSSSIDRFSNSERFNSLNTPLKTKSPQKNISNLYNDTTMPIKKQNIIDNEPTLKTKSPQQKISYGSYDTTMPLKKSNLLEKKPTLKTKSPQKKILLNPSQTIENFTDDLEENNALPKSINSQFDIPPLEITKSKKPSGKPAEQEQLYHNYKHKTSRQPNYNSAVENTNSTEEDQEEQEEESSKLEEPQIEGFYGGMNSRFSGPTPQVTSRPYASVPEHPPVPEFNVGEAESLFSNYNGGSSRTPSYIDKSGMVEGFVGGDVVKSFKTNNPFDIAGCRYDGDNERPLHDVIYGAPLASCGAYGNMNNSIGTVFYPLNN